MLVLRGRLERFGFFGGYFVRPFPVQIPGCICYGSVLVRYELFRPRQPYEYATGVQAERSFLSSG